MARDLRQSTSVDLPIGPFVDTAGAAVTTLTITQPDIRLKKGGASWAQKNAAQTLSHEENGMYEVTLDATDTNTLGPMRLASVKAGALQVWEDFQVMPANVWDSLYSTDLLQVDLTQIIGGAVPAPAVTGVIKADVTHFAGTATTASAGRPEVNTSHVGGTVQSAGDIIGDTNDIQARLPASLVGGRMDSSTGSMAANVVTATAIATAAIDADSIATDAITAAKIAADAIGASELATDAVTEIVDAIKAAVIETQGSYTIQQTLSILLSVLAGVTSSNGAVFKSPNGVSTRVTATPDGSNNRTSMTLVPSA
jgi:hypothetical protein